MKGNGFRGPIWKCVTADAFTAFVSIFALAKQLRLEAAQRKSVFVRLALFPLYTSVSRGECAGMMSQGGRREFIARKRNALSSSQRNNSNSFKEKKCFIRCLFRLLLSAVTTWMCQLFHHRKCLRHACQGIGFCWLKYIYSCRLAVKSLPLNSN